MRKHNKHSLKKLYKRITSEKKTYKTARGLLNVCPNQEIMLAVIYNTKNLFFGVGNPKLKFLCVTNNDKTNESRLIEKFCS